jgi:hypothetical protein
VRVPSQRGVSGARRLRQRCARRRRKGRAHLLRELLHDGAPHFSVRVPLDGGEQLHTRLLPTATARVAAAPPRYRWRALHPPLASCTAIQHRPRVRGSVFVWCVPKSLRRRREHGGDVRRQVWAARRDCGAAGGP